MKFVYIYIYKVIVQAARKENNKRGNLLAATSAYFTCRREYSSLFFILNKTEHFETYF